MTTIVKPDGEIDTSARFSVKGWRGIAFRAIGWPQVWMPYTTFQTDPETGDEYELDTDEGEWNDNRAEGQIIAVMVGDDHKHVIDLEDITILTDSEYCLECGQIGCTADGRDREEG